VSWRFDDDPIGADAVHHVVKPFWPSGQIPFNPQPKLRVGDYADLPSRRPGETLQYSIEVEKNPFSVGFASKLLNGVAAVADLATDLYVVSGP
jgi:hypothetical protein